MITPDGRFHAKIWPGRRDLEEGFRRRFLRHLRRAKRLAASFHETLLSWRHSGFSVDASQRVGAGEEARLARYATRVPVAVGAVRERGDGRTEIDTPPDPRTGTTMKVLIRLDFVHAVCQQIPDRGRHRTRYYGAYANQKRTSLRPAFEAEGKRTAPRPVRPERATGKATASYPAARRSADARPGRGCSGRCSKSNRSSVPGAARKWSPSRESPTPR